MWFVSVLDDFDVRGRAAGAFPRASMNPSSFRRSLVFCRALDGASAFAVARALEHAHTFGGFWPDVCARGSAHPP